MKGPDPEPRQGRLERYGEVQSALAALLADETDFIAALATTACELHYAFDHYDWTGFYRLVRPDLLVIGPYQGTHGCLRIAVTRGVCGAAVRSRATQRVDRVADRPDHIACSSSTRSEIVVPVVSRQRGVLAVLDVDSNREAAFTDVDQSALEDICRDLAERFPFGDAHRAGPT